MCMCNHKDTDAPKAVSAPRLGLSNVITLAIKCVDPQ